MLKNIIPEFIAGTISVIFLLATGSGSLLAQDADPAASGKVNIPLHGWVSVGTTIREFGSNQSFDP